MNGFIRFMAVYLASVACTFVALEVAEMVVDKQLDQ